MKKQFFSLPIVSLFFIYFVTKSHLAYAQIKADDTLSTKVQTSEQLEFIINNGKQVGGNLFHSFKEFSVPERGKALFANNSNVKNIIIRVTGGLISYINGLIQTKGSANLFLINPNGIIFGSNASLNINGSFIASTASKVLFAGDNQFSASNPRIPPLLTENVPIGLQFGVTAQPIQINGSTLKVLPGETLAMLGGDIFINGGKLSAPTGRIELGSVADNSLVTLTPITKGWVLGYANLQNFKDIQVTEKSIVDISGEGNGVIQLYGKKIAIINKSELGGATTGNKPGQPLAIKASESVELSGDSSRLFTLTINTGAGGNITIETKKLFVHEGGVIEATTLGSGQGGSLTIDASESIEILGNRKSFSRLSVRTTSTKKDAGNAGKMQISTKNLILGNGGQITTSTLGSGNGGTLKIDASDSIEASGRIVVRNTAAKRAFNFPSGLFSESIGGGTVPTTGKGGDLIVNTQRLVVKNGATISVATIDNSQGDAGILDIIAPDSVIVTGTGIDKNGQTAPSSLFAASEGSGSAGNLRINTGTLTVRDGAEVSVSSKGSGSAGNLTISANTIRLNQGRLTAETNAGEGANIKLQDLDLLLLQNQSLISAQAFNNANGGNIDIIAPNGFVVAAPNQNNDIVANAFQGQGGQINITSNGIFGIAERSSTPANTTNDIDASSEFGSSGTINLNTAEADPSRGLVELPSNLVDPSEQISTACNPGNRQSQSSLVATGRGGLPPSPYESLDSSEVWRDVQLPRQLAQSSVTVSPEKIVEAQGWIVNKNGDVELIAQVPTATSQGRCGLP
jgi:filamentous hemagglutinin family protein